MTTGSDRLLHERFALSAPAPAPPDWHDVVTRSRRHAAQPGATVARRVLVLAAVLVGVLAIAASAIAISGATTGIHALDELLNRVSQPPGGSATHRRRLRVSPVAGSISEPLSFERNGITYTAIGFRSRDGMICAALADQGAPTPQASRGVGCLRAQLLRRALKDVPAHVFAGGGGPHLLAVQGLARADVIRISFADGRSGSSIGLSRPWKPKPWGGAPIRFFYTLTPPPPPGSDPAGPSWRGLRLTAELANGESVEVGP